MWTSDACDLSSWSKVTCTPLSIFFKVSNIDQTDKSYPGIILFKLCLGSLKESETGMRIAQSGAVPVVRSQFAADSV